MKRANVPRFTFNWPCRELEFQTTPTANETTRRDSINYSANSGSNWKDHTNSRMTSRNLRDGERDPTVDERKAENDYLL